MSRRRWGCRSRKLIVATNVNDILHRALSSGDYSVGTVTPTAAPSMDIQVSSQFRAAAVRSARPRRRGAGRSRCRGSRRRTAIRLTNALREGAAELFTSARDRSRRRWRWRCAGRASDAGQVIDPHTAIGLAAARRADLPADVPIVTLATAHPAKFRDAVERATGVRPPLPARLGDLFDREERYDTCPATSTRSPPTSPERAAAMNLHDADRRALGRLRPGRLRPWPEARALRPLPLHPPRTAGDVGTGAPTIGARMPNSSPAPTRTAAAVGVLASRPRAKAGRSRGTT